MILFGFQPSKVMQDMAIHNFSPSKMIRHGALSISVINIDYLDGVQRQSPENKIKNLSWYTLISYFRDGNNSCPISADDPWRPWRPRSRICWRPRRPRRPLTRPDDPWRPLTTLDDPWRPLTTPDRLPQEIFVRFDAPVSDLCSCVERIGL